MQAQLQQLNSLPQKDRTQACIAILNDTFTSSTNLVSDVSTFVDHVLQPEFAQIVAYQALTQLVTLMSSSSNLNIDTDLRKQLLSLTLDKMSTRTSQFEQQTSALREQYADLLEQDEEYTEAARILIGIPLESSSRSIEDKLRIYIRIVRLFLEEQDSTSAETFFNRASLIIHQTKNQELQLHYKLSQARMFDFDRKFVEAASKYHDISYNQMIGEDERLHTLNVAITCAVLAPAGPQRSRILTSLYKDDRSNQTQHFKILSKMFLDQLIETNQIKEFSLNLKPHQLAKLSTPRVVKLSTEQQQRQDQEIDTTNNKNGPETVLDRAIMEHNILACSKVYNNITFTGLGRLLGLKPLASEVMVRTMIGQGRLKATIDQVEELIMFDVDVRDNDGVVSNVAQKMMSEATTTTTSSSSTMAGGGAGLNEQDTNMMTGLDDQVTAPATLRFDAHVRRTLQLTETIAMRCQTLLEQGKQKPQSTQV
ncbi:hypothetical protein OIO90_005154 [Microbotryomycetes sp. JL221]|nr:hypothetical protein OIO90_005154 [Microbotryomycetes sp. JL221]